MEQNPSRAGIGPIGGARSSQISSKPRSRVGSSSSRIDPQGKSGGEATPLHSPRAWLRWAAYVLEAQARPFSPKYDRIPGTDPRGMHPTTGAKILKRLKEQGEEISAFMSPQRDEKLGKLVDHFLDKGIKLRQVKGSDALGAAKLYADRRFPVRQDPAPASFSFADINLNVFLPDPPPEPKTIKLEPGADDEPPEGTP